MRHTIKDVEFYLTCLNDVLKYEQQDGYKIQKVNGYINIDTHDNYHVITGLTTGEAYKVLYAMYMVAEREQKLNRGK